jgi:hypothetical protein
MLANATPAHSCSYEKFSDEQQYERASTVFIAHVFRTEEAREPSPLSIEPEPIVEATFRLVETLKGKPPAEGKVKSTRFSNGNCSVFLIAGVDYLFFLHDETGSYALLPGGSRPILIEGADSVTAKAKNLLQSFAHFRIKQSKATWASLASVTRIYTGIVFEVEPPKR